MPRSDHPASRRADHRIIVSPTRGCSPMRLTASFALLTFAGSVIGCSTAPGPATEGDPNAPLCAFSGLTPASPEWSGCLTSLAVNPDRDLLGAVIKAREDGGARGASRGPAEVQK